MLARVRDEGTSTKARSMTRLCVPLFVTDVNQLRRDAVLAAEAGADMLELRIDELTEPTQLPDLSLPYILTCRPANEGGQSELSVEDRLNLLDAMSAGRATYIDIELQTYQKRPDVVDLTKGGRRIIISTHEFSGRPPRLHNWLVEMAKQEASVHKIVWMARSIRDNLEAFELLREPLRPTIALCMGEHGLISRILAKKFGAFLTFASLNNQSGTAPGQISIDDLKNIYRWDKLVASTKVYGVIASPVMHSMSPAIHNAAFDAVGHDGVYVPMLVNPGYESFKAWMESALAFEPLDLSGLSITLPHKENALRYLQEKGAKIEPLAQSIGAVNTIIIERNGGLHLHGLNTDYAAILDSITDKLNINREQLAGYRIAVIGAGGTGRTAVAALAYYGATIVVYNRTVERAQQLAAEFDGNRGKVVAMPIDRLCDSCCQIYLNCTSVGMYPNVDASPLGDTPPKITSDTVVFDTVYNPMETKLLQHANSRGAMTISGVEMFVRQAAAQFEAWTNQSAPTQIMRRVVEGRLAST